MSNYYDRMKYNGGGNSQRYTDFNGRHINPTPSGGVVVDWDRLSHLAAGRISLLYTRGLYTAGMIASDLGQRRSDVNYYINNHPDISPIIRTRTVKLYSTAVWYEMLRLFSRENSRMEMPRGSQFIGESEL